MSIQTRMENILKLFIPPIVIKGARFVQNLFKKPDLHSMGFHTLEYAPNGWQTQLNNNRNKGWSVNSVIDTEKAKWDVFCRNLEGPGPLGFSPALIGWETGTLGHGRVCAFWETFCSSFNQSPENARTASPIQCRRDPVDD